MTQITLPQKNDERSVEYVARRFPANSDAEGYSDAIGKMLFTQSRGELQKLCPYLHVVSLLRDQIPDRARNPDNSSFDPSPMGSSLVPAGPVCAREPVKTDERRNEKKRI